MIPLKYGEMLKNRSHWYFWVKTSNLKPAFLVKFQQHFLNMVRFQEKLGDESQVRM